MAKSYDCSSANPGSGTENENPARARYRGSEIECVGFLVNGWPWGTTSTSKTKASPSGSLAITLSDGTPMTVQNGLGHISLFRSPLSSCIPQTLPAGAWLSRLTSTANVAV